MKPRWRLLERKPRFKLARTVKLSTTKSRPESHVNFGPGPFPVVYHCHSLKLASLAQIYGTCRHVEHLSSPTARERAVNGRHDFCGRHYGCGVVRSVIICRDGWFNLRYGSRSFLFV